MKDISASYGQAQVSDEGDVRELMEDDFAHMKPFAQMSKEFRGKFSGPATIKPDGGPVYVPVAADVVESFQRTGEDWDQTLNQALRDWLNTHAA